MCLQASGTSAVSHGGCVSSNQSYCLKLGKGAVLANNLNYWWIQQLISWSREVNKDRWMMMSDMSINKNKGHKGLTGRFRSTSWWRTDPHRQMVCLCVIVCVCVYGWGGGVVSHCVFLMISSIPDKIYCSATNNTDGGGKYFTHLTLLQSRSKYCCFYSITLIESCSYFTEGVTNRTA